ncbi:MAG: LytTR family transcriptional regulator DNA-binding domain-containing protein [Lachnospiraceae bacterium]|nr:LytTR family transcriptional regulator DNA-binding domain-containing protein [Lachnospiraceae bacterium]
MQRNILIVEDNETHMNALYAIIEELHKDVRVYCANSIEKAFQLALEYHIHLFLIDIILNTKKPGDVSGLSFAKEIRGVVKYKFTPLVFITSLEDPKLYSYSQLHCLGYIEKPFSVAQVRDTILDALEFPVREEDDRYAYFRKDGIVYSVYIKDIIYIQSIRRKIKIFCVNDELEIPYKTCGEILKELNSKSFIACSRYCIVNRKYIEQIDYVNRYIKLKYINSPVEIGVVMKKAFKEKMDDDE